MSRSKKSRKPGVGSSGPVKDDKKKNIVVAEKRPKKHHGKKPGNRQQEAVQKQPQEHNGSLNKDPRIGSKKPIVLTPSVEKKKVAPFQAKIKNKTAVSPIAAIRVVEPLQDNEALETDLYAIEDDPSLQSILAKQEDDIELNEAEVDFFNEKMTRHQEIRTLLGLSDEDDEDDDDESTSDDKQDDDSLWDKLDSNDLTSFEKE